MTHRSFKLRKNALILCLTWLMPVIAAAASTSSPAVTPEYAEITLALGSVTKTVIATGALRFDQEESLTLPEDITLSAIEAVQGDAVASGQVLAHYDIQALQDAIDAAQAALDEQDETLLTLLSQQKSDQSIQPAMAGVVKVMNLQEGKMVQQCLQGKPAAILSTNGLMQVHITPTATLTLGQTVQVKVGAQNQTGSVARLMDDGSALITFPDTRALADETVQVTYNGGTVGEGSAQISQPYDLYTDVEGVVDSVSVKVNASVKPNSVLAKVTNAEPATEYRQAQEEREDRAQQLQKLQALLDDPVYRSPMDGIVSEVTAQTGQALSKGDCLMKLYPNQAFVMDVAVDELDILSVMEGQEGTVALDALPDVQLPVRVERISRLGSTTSGITNYTVTLSVQEDSRLLSGMNGTMTLIVGEEAGTVLVPLVALMNDRQGNYVLLKDDTLAADAAQTGIKTYVQVGLSDANYAAVISGLQAGDVVLVRAGAMAQTDNSQRQQMPDFGQMPDFDQMPPPGDGMPGGGPGGNFQPGGGQRP